MEYKIKKLLLGVILLTSVSSYANSEEYCFSLEKQLYFHSKIESDLTRKKDRLETFLKIDPSINKITNDFAIRMAKGILALYQNKDTWSVSVPLLNYQSDVVQKIEQVSLNSADSTKENLAVALIISIDTILRDANFIQNELIGSKKVNCPDYK